MLLLTISRKVRVVQSKNSKALECDSKQGIAFNSDPVTYLLYDSGQGI